MKETKVRDLMRVHVATIGPDATLRDVIEKMELYQVLSLTIVDADARPLGLVQFDDIIREFFSLTPDQRGALRGGDMMSPGPKNEIDENALAEEAIGRMMDENHDVMNVVAEGTFAGTISRLDIVAAIVRKESVPKS